MMENPYKTTPKPITELTDTQLCEEWRHWNWEITNAKAWGAALATAVEFRKDIVQECMRRGIELGKELE